MTDTSPHLRVTEPTGILAAAWELLRELLARFFESARMVLDELDALTERLVA